MRGGKKNYEINFYLFSNDRELHYNLLFGICYRLHFALAATHGGKGSLYNGVSNNGGSK